MGLGCVNIVFSGVILVSMAAVLQCSQAGDNNWWNGLLNKFSSVSADRELNHVIDRDFEPSNDRSQEKDLDDALIKFYQAFKTKEDDDSEEDKRVGFGGLLCCNHPPTKQPTIKRSHPGVIDERMVKSMILSTILKTILDESSDRHSLNDQDSYRLDIGQNLGDPSSSDDDDNLMMQRRGVTKTYDIIANIPGVRRQEYLGLIG
ncbi:unnamed protein product [Lymnaea stagnalis]|uniref:Uncharacterized protein n=1 Tax=Lymnaea stagnalis TaxID=6523 RepID=A0AAV2H9L9_LYMST